jgi:neopullulanase
MDFPGGWKGDKKNAFTGEGLSADEAAVQDLVRKLGGFRKNSSALRTGKLMQYAPKKGLYVYFRYDAAQTVMCVMNTGKEAIAVDFNHYAERTAGFVQAVDVVSGDSFHMTTTMPVAPMQMKVLELKR